MYTSIYSNETNVKPSEIHGGVTDLFLTNLICLIALIVWHLEFERKIYIYSHNLQNSYRHMFDWTNCGFQQEVISDNVHEKNHK